MKGPQPLPFFGNYLQIHKKVASYIDLSWVQDLGHKPLAVASIKCSTGAQIEWAPYAPAGQVLARPEQCREFAS